jgi:hypothetical protein
MSILWKNGLARSILYFNDLQNSPDEDFTIIRFLEGHIQLSKAQLVLRIGGLDHPGKCGKKAPGLHDHPGC